MKANEIMIGDWVRLRYKRSDMTEVVKDFQVSELRRFYKECPDVEAWSKESGNMGDVERLEPIPLTPEILEKNGFKNYGESWYLPDDDVKVMVGFYMYETTIHVKKGDDIFQKEVRCSYRACAENRDVHVHTLQHALRLCGIDNEIEL